MKKITRNSFTRAKKLLCDWSDQKNYLVHFRMLKFYVRHAMVVEKVQEIISFKQCKWLEKCINFNTQKGNKAKNDFEKIFYKLLINAFYGKTMENVRNRLGLEIIEKDDYKKNIKQQPNFTFNGIHESYEKYDCYLLKKNEVKMDKPIFLGFAVLELSKLHMCKTCHGKSQIYLSQENIQLQFIDTDAFVLSMNTKDLFKDLKNLEDTFDCSNLD